MKNNIKKLLVLLAVVCLVVGAINISASASAVMPAADPSPAIYVTQKTVNSVVGVIASEETWDPVNGTSSQVVSQGSGVVIRDGGYIMTNHHVVDSGSSYQILMPSGEKIPAKIVGSDESTDIAVLQLVDEAKAAELVAVEIGSMEELQVGSTVIAIGNPGGEILANTVTQGIVSALERTTVQADEKPTREISYIQHDATINSGNSGGGLFNYKGELIGINNLKYTGRVYSGMVMEGLGFAIPVSTAVEIANDLMEFGQVQRPMLGITCYEQDGPDDAMRNYPPASICVATIMEGGPAEKAGLLPYDYIVAVDGERVTSLVELTTELDSHEVGDVVEVTLVRYENLAAYMNAAQNYREGANVPTVTFTGEYEYMTIEVTLDIVND